MCLAQNSRRNNNNNKLITTAVNHTVMKRSRPVTPPHHTVHAHLMVHHNYHDRSQEMPRNEDLMMEQSQHAAHHDSAPFPLKLHDMLDRVESEGFSHVISWQPHGRCFIIHQPKEFTNTLLPRYFNKITKLASFQRQLNLYGFNRITQGLDKGAYYNEYFLRSKQFLVHQIQRIKVKGTGVRAKSNPAEEPDLWAMPWVMTNNTAAVMTPVSQTQTVVEQEQDNDSVLLTEWGHSFYALDNLPCDIISATKAAPMVTVERPLNQSLEQELLEDPVLSSMLLGNATTQEQVTTDNLDLVDLLDNVVSWSTEPTAMAL